MFSYSLDNGKIIMTAQIIQTQKRLQNIASVHFISIWKKRRLNRKTTELNYFQIDITAQLARG